MCPVILQIGPLTLAAYGLMAALGFLAAWFLIIPTARDRGLDSQLLQGLCFWMVLAGLVGARAAYVIFHWPDFSTRPFQIFNYWQGGLMFQGGLLGALAAAPMVLKKYALSWAPAADALAPALALAQGLGRVGCFLAGCCYGRPTDLPWGVTFPEGSLAQAGEPRHPTQLYEAAGLFLGAGLMLLALKKKGGWWARPGTVAAFYLVWAGTWRFGVEFFRGDFRGLLPWTDWSPTHLLAGFLVIGGLWLMTTRRGH